MRSLIAAACLLVIAAACGPRTGATGSPDAGTGTDMPPTGDTDAGTNGTDAGAPQVTWYKHVLPIVQAQCQGCHVSGGIGPFPMESYADAAAHHEAIASSVVTRTMPPWLADESCIDLKDSRVLTQAEIDLIAEWSATGAAEGDPNDAPEPPANKPGLEWVDATIQPAEDYTPSATITDDYRCFQVPPTFDGQHDIIGYEVVPGTPNQVHHVILVAVPAAEAQAADDAEPGFGWTCYGGFGPEIPRNNLRMVGGWVPGSAATRFPADTGIQVGAGEVVVMQIHYNTANGPPQPDRTQIKLQYAKTPVASPAIIIPVGIYGFTIPPNNPGYSLTDTFTVPFEATVHGYTPHMHNRGKSISVRNANSGQCIVSVPKWDFDWQQPYQFEEPVVAFAGDQFETTCTWDNPTSVPIIEGEKTTEEMCVTFFYVTF